MDNRLLLSFFKGLWTFVREVRSLDMPFSLLASVTEGRASFDPWASEEMLSQGNGNSAVNSAPSLHQEVKATVSLTRLEEHVEETCPISPDPHQAMKPESAWQSSQWLLYREHGTLKNHRGNAPSGVVTRQYLYNFSNPSKLQVYYCSSRQRASNLLDPWVALNMNTISNFEQGKPFHELEFPLNEYGSRDLESLSNVEATSVHVCVPDLYKGHFLLKDWNTVLVKWTVTGPSKSFLIQTTYHRK